LVFPYFENDRIVAEHYRGPLPEKRFSQKPGGKKIFWNVEAIDFVVGQPEKVLYIFEGELDALTAIDCGFEASMSVPDGAPAQMGELDPATEETSKFAYVFNTRMQLKEVKRFVLAVDDDDAGKVLAAELVRRFGASRCSFVEYPD